MIIVVESIDKNTQDKGDPKQINQNSTYDS